ncbi:MAG: LysM peptidoglycan-binding domain-containing protein, partial [Bacteroidota bacterium]
LRYIRPAKVPIEYKDIVEPEPVKKAPIPAQADSSSTKNAAAVAISAVEEDGNEARQPLTFLQQLDSLDKLEQEEAAITVLPDSAELHDAVQLTLTESQVALSTADSAVHIHSVAAGDTFYAISKKYQVNVLDILEWNGLSINDKLSIDQKIKVYVKRDSEAKRPQMLKKEQNDDSFFIRYVVKEGDTLYSIARSNEVRVEDLLDWNDKNEASIKLGEVLKIKKLTSD